MRALGLVLVVVALLWLAARAAYVDLGDRLSWLIETLDEGTRGRLLWIVLAAGCALIASGCAFDLATRRGPADERVVLLHVSLLRRGCYAMTGGDLSLEAEDRAASRELAAAATVGGAIAAGPVGAGVAAVGAALSEAVGDPPPEVPCR
jgi:hypothetical protein